MLSLSNYNILSKNKLLLEDSQDLWTDEFYTHVNLDQSEAFHTSVLLLPHICINILMKI